MGFFPESETLALTVIALLGIFPLFPRLFTLVQDEAAAQPAELDSSDAAYSEQSKLVFIKTRPILLIFGVVIGTIASGVDAISQPLSPILWACVMLSIQAGFTLSEQTPKKQFRIALHGAISSIVLISLLTFHLINAVDADITVHSRHLTVLIAAVLTLVGFLSIPQQPDRFINGRPIDRQYSASILEIASFSWAKALFSPAVISKTVASELPALHPTIRANNLVQQYITAAASNKHGLKTTLIKTYTPKIILQWSLAILSAAVNLFPQYLTFHFLKQLEVDPLELDEKSWRYEALFLALLLGFGKIFELWIRSWLQWVTISKILIPIQATLSSLVYRKTLSLPNAIDGQASGNNNEGSNKRPQRSILTHMRLDSAKACMVFTDTNTIPMLLIKLLWTTYFLISLVGWQSLLPGLIASILIIPLTTVITKKYTTALSKQMDRRDARVALLKDALLAIRQLKLAAVERLWTQKIIRARHEELGRLFKGAIWMCTLVFTANVSPMLFAGIPIYIFSIRDKQLTAPVAFICINLFQQLQSDLSILPLNTTYFIEALASLKRLEAFFAEPEVERSNITVSNSVSCKNADISWSSSPQGFTLRNLSLEFPDGELSLVTGETGSGKSLLLSALAGEASILSGDIYTPLGEQINSSKKTSGSLAIVSQSPWLENTTIRNNILFGLPFNKARYDTVINSCALARDLKALKDGDSTIVGLKGAALSGGQKWRVALARALYSNASVLLLEDILGAVDATVRGWLIGNALCGEIAKGRTRILITHHVAQCRPKASYLIKLKNGAAKTEVLLPISSVSLSGEQILVRDSLNKMKKDDSGPQQKETDTINLADAKNATNTNNNTNTLNDPNTNNSKNSTKDANKTNGQKPLPNETPANQTKSSSLSLYTAYFHASGGQRAWLLAMIVVIACETLKFAKSWWLKDWTTYMAESIGRDTTSSERDGHIFYYGAVFMAVSFLGCLFITIRCLVWYILGVTASRRLFETMTGSILGSYLHWLEGTPHGDIIVRFTSDINTVDQRLPHDIGYLIEQLVNILTTILSTIFISPTSAFFALLLLYIYYRVGIRLISVAKSFKTISLGATSVLYQQLGSLLASDAVLTVRAYSMTNYFTDQMFSFIDNTSSAEWHHSLCKIMMDLQLGALSALFLTLVAIGSVFGSVSAGTAGIALSFASQFGADMSGFLRRIAVVEASLRSAERIIEYGNLATEPDNGSIPESNWPSSGSIKVDNLVAGYQGGGAFHVALDGISFFAAPGERIAIVGRTGAGKSSLTLAFARLLNLIRGSIIIDGVDISTINLHALRKKLFFIPQDPHMFAGTLRSTLDPEGSFDDDTLMTALSKASFTGQNQEIAIDLSFAISEGGSNISQGQRQMLCLARAFLKRPKIVIMDEATSAIDMETDAAIQKSIRTALPDTTVIVIVHRLATVVDFDKILVLEAGSVVEFGTPTEIYKKQGSFWNLVNHSSDSERLIRQIFK